MISPADRPPFPESITSDRLILRPPGPDDAGEIIAAIDESRAELRSWMVWEPWMQTIDDANELIRRQANNRDTGTDFGLGIFRRADGRYLGGTGYHDIDWHVPSMAIGYWMRTSEVGNGYVRETVTALAHYGFAHFGLRRLVITCAATNERSKRVAEAVGFHLEGRLRNHDRLPDGSLRDTLVYSLIDTDDAVPRMADRS